MSEEKRGGLEGVVEYLLSEEKKEKEIKELHIEKIKSFVKGILDDSFGSFAGDFNAKFPGKKCGKGWGCDNCGGCLDEDIDIDEAREWLAAREEKIKKVIDNANWDNILN